MLLWRLVALGVSSPSLLSVAYAPHLSLATTTLRHRPHALRMYGDNEGRHRHKMARRRSSSSHARAAPSQPLAGHAPVSRGSQGERRRLKAHGVRTNGPRRRLGPESKPASAKMASKLMGLGTETPMQPPMEPARSGFVRGGEFRPGPNDAMVEAVLTQREAARAAGDYATADRLRATLRRIGVEVHDDARLWRWK